MLLFLRILLGVTLIAIALAWWLSAPVTLDKSQMQALPEGNPEAGAMVFAAAGCGSCHTAPDAEPSGASILSGGRRFPSPYGTFVAPNISPHPEHGIGDWSTHDLAQAMWNGVSPDGQHYFPAFPYTSYANANLDDINDLNAYLKTLPASDRPNEPHDIGIPFSIRRGLGLWKQLYLRPGWIVETAGEPELERGRYLVEALGHCAECHTPRTALGGLDRSAWLAGAPNPSGEGQIPGIRPDVLGWSAEDLAYYFESGFTPDFDSAGGHMAEVVENLAQLPPQDRAAIAAYLLALEGS